MSVSLYDVEILKSAGFLDYEIQRFADARTPDGSLQPPIDIDSSPWQLMIQSRMEWVESKINQGWSEYEIRNEIMAYYAGGVNRNPFDFLKLNYALTRPAKRINYWEAIANRKSSQVKGVMGDYQ